MKQVMHKRLITGLYFGNIIGISLYWWLTFGTHTNPTTSNILIAISHWAGLVTVIVVLTELLMMARVRFIENAYSLDELTRIHRWNGYAVVVLLLIHALFVTVGYQLVSSNSFIGQLVAFSLSYEDVLNAIIGAILFLIVAGSSVKIARAAVSYEVWYFIHLLAYFAIVLTFGHQVHSGPDFIAHPGFAAYWYVLYGLVAAIIAYARFLRPIINSLRLDLRIANIAHETHDTYTMTLDTQRPDLFDYQAGQFAIWYVLTKKLWWQGHPFSMSSKPGEPLRFSVKIEGNYTTDLQAAAIGSRVWVDGPHGRFVYNRATSKKLLMIAGGVGVTPIYSLLKEIPADYHVVLLYACRSSDDVLFRDAIDDLARDKNITVNYYYSQQPGASAQYIDKAVLGEVQDLAAHDVFLCGPPAMMDSITDLLVNLGVPKKHIYSERFDY